MSLRSSNHNYLNLAVSNLFVLCYKDKTNIFVSLMKVRCSSYLLCFNNCGLNHSYFKYIVLYLFYNILGCIYFIRKKKNSQYL